MVGNASTPDLLDALASDHTEVRAMIAEVFANSGRRRALYPRISEALRYHANAEEKTLYQALGSYPQEVAEIDRSYDEHGALDHALRELDATAYGDPSFMDRFAHMNAMLEQHLAAEESRVFVAAQALLDPAVRRRLGAQYERLMGRGPSVSGGMYRQANPCRSCQPAPRGLVANVKQALENPTESGRPRWHSLVGIWPFFSKVR